MLASLTIQNVVLIEKLTIHFQEGLCALTGETGAGKSILLDALGLALGARSDSGLVRKDAQQAVVIAEFTLPEGHDALAFLKAQDLEAAPDIILRRSVGVDGRSKAYVNDQPVSVALLKELGERLVEIHGQFETQSLLNPREHRGLLDAYGVKPADIKAMQSAWENWKACEQELTAARAAMHQARAEEEFLRAALQDLDELTPKEGEQQRLSILRERLMKREQYLAALSAADAAVNEAQGAMSGGWRALERMGQEAKSLLEGLDRAAAELQDVQGGIAALSADLEESEFSLQEIDDRLFALKAQARKLSCTIDELPAKREGLAARLTLIEKQDDVLESLYKKGEEAKGVYKTSAEKVAGARRQAAGRLDRLVEKELVPLKLGKARFETSIETLPEGEWGAGGTDRVQFLVATNPGAAAGPLNRIASGGEMARFMLALKVVMAEVGAAATMVFDEVDSGIGGATADAVGERLSRLSQKRQILVVTHSPQVAARAAHHWIVAKDGGRDVRTNVIPLPDFAKRREEIARMLSGAEITEEARAAASKLLEGRAA